MAEKQTTSGTATTVPAPRVVLDIGLAFTKRIFTARSKSTHGAATYKRDVLYAALREMVSGFSVAQAQLLLPKTDTVYKAVAKLHNSKPNSVELENGAKGHWIGKKDAAHVILFLHGGGFYAPATWGHLQYQFAIKKHMRKQGHDVSIFSLSYTIAPIEVYPTQLRQAASALYYLVEVEHRDPSTIILCGDSAGGNLSSALLLHLARPHPSVLPVKLACPLRAALLISPWISFKVEDPSFFRNAQSDYLTTKALNRASNAYIAVGSQHDNYSQPVDAPAEWWRDVASGVVDEIMVWGGESEILIDSILRFAGTISTGFLDAGVKHAARMASTSRERFSLIVTPDHGHDEMILDHILGRPTMGEGAKEIEKWLSAVLG